MRNVTCLARAAMWSVRFALAIQTIRNCVPAADALTVVLKERVFVVSTLCALEAVGAPLMRIILQDPVQITSKASARVTIARPATVLRCAVELLASITVALFTHIFVVRIETRT